MSESEASRPAPPSPQRAQVGREVAARLSAHPAVSRMPIETAEVFLCRSFLAPRECEILCRMIDGGAQPSRTIVEGDPDYRTSWTCELDPAAVRPIDLRLSDLLGIAPGHGEPLQGQRYAPGQQYRPHYDWFFEDDLWPEIRKQGGHRTWTAMAYLSLTSGGGTFFPRLGMRVTPMPGALLIWSNMNPDGSFNEFTLHEGEPVTAGTKYVITKWYRELAR